MRSRTCFRVALEAEDWLADQFESLQAAVEQGYVSYPRIPRQRVGIDREAVILAGDHDSSAIQILHRVICTMMAEFHL